MSIAHMYLRPHFLIERKELSISSWQEIKQGTEKKKTIFLKSLKEKRTFIYLFVIQFWHVIQQPPVSSKCFTNQGNNNNNSIRIFFSRKIKKIKAIDTPKFINKKKIKRKKFRVVLWLSLTLWKYFVVVNCANSKYLLSRIQQC